MAEKNRISEVGWELLARRKKGRYLSLNSGIYYRVTIPGTLEFCWGEGGNSGTVSFPGLDISHVAILVEAFKSSYGRVAESPGEDDTIPLPLPVAPPPPLPEPKNPLQPSKRRSIYTIPLTDDEIAEVARKQKLGIIGAASLSASEIALILRAHLLFIEQGNVRGAKRAFFKGENLNNLDIFVGKELTRACFRQTNLFKTKFTGATVTWADFRGAYVEKADFTGCIGLSKATFAGCIGRPIGVPGLENAPSVEKTPCSVPASKAVHLPLESEHLAQVRAIKAGEEEGAYGSGKARQRLKNDRGDRIPRTPAQEERRRSKPEKATKKPSKR